MLKLKEVYLLPTKPVLHTTWVLSGQWLPEIQDLDSNCTTEFLETLDLEKRFDVRQLMFEYFDGERSAQMHTLWFDGKPVCIVQDAGRGLRDHHRRWVTDAAAFEQLVAYLRSRLPCEQVHISDPEADLYPEEVFCFYGMDFSERFGIQVEPLTPGFMLVQSVNLFKDRRPVPEVLLSTTSAEAPAYVRRGSSVFKLVRPVSDEEHAANPRIAQVLAEDGFIGHYWYERTTRPEGLPVISI
ncbi:MULTISPECIES: hypothetical protein [unclassified Variovorax]|nr:MULTISPECIES: hypothetical protein [unclassified Variovorax]